MNTNCLTGTQCPKCGSTGPLDYTRDTSLSSSVLKRGIIPSVTTYCRCDDCDHVGEVADFKQQETNQ